MDLPVAAEASEMGKESDEVFRLLVDGVKDYAIFVLGPDGRVRTWNRGAERIKGYAAEEIIGQHFSVFYPPASTDAGICDRELAIAAREGRFEDEGWRVRKDKSQFWAHVTITALRGPDDALVGFAEVTQDLTERMRAEAERVSLARAEEAERRNSEFLAVLGHELRNPLAPLATALQIIRLRGGRNCDKELAILDRQLTHMTRLVNDVLDAARFARNEIPLVRNVTETGEVLANAVEVAAPLIEERRHRLRLDVPPEGLLIDVDSARMTQVFGNLLRKAAQYTAPGGTIRLGARAEGPSVVVTVEDTGVGIAPELLPRMFDLFTQGEQGIDRRQGGLGIGLSIARAVTVEHGGQIAAESAGRGRGSRFTVRLPRVTRTKVSESTPPARAAASVRSRRLLVVEDNEDAAAMLGTLLEELGYQVQIAFDGPSALLAVPIFQPDLVLLDIGLPGPSGYEVAAQMRQTPFCATVPIVAVTGYARASDRARAREAGFSALLPKPIDAGRLSEIVEEMFSLPAA